MPLTLNQQKEDSLAISNISANGYQASNSMSCFQDHVPTHLQAAEERNHFAVQQLQWLSWILNRAILAGSRPQQAIENHPNVLDQNEWQNEISAKNTWDTAWCWNLLCRFYKSFWLKLYLLFCCLSSHYCEQQKGQGIKIANDCKKLVDN